MTNIHRLSYRFGPACLGFVVAVSGLLLAAPAQAHPRGNRYSGASVEVRVGSPDCYRNQVPRYHSRGNSYPASYARPRGHAYSGYSYSPGYSQPGYYQPGYVVVPQPYFPYYNTVTVQTYTRPSPEIVVDPQGVVRFKNPPGY